jgi:hypothetical protein
MNAKKIIELTQDDIIRAIGFWLFSKGQISSPDSDAEIAIWIHPARHRFVPHDGGHFISATCTVGGEVR